MAQRRREELLRPFAQRRRTFGLVRAVAEREGEQPRGTVLGVRHGFGSHGKRARRGLPQIAAGGFGKKGDLHRLGHRAPVTLRNGKKVASARIAAVPDGAEPLGAVGHGDSSFVSVPSGYQDKTENGIFFPE